MKEIDYIEHRFSVFIAKTETNLDTHLVKELITYKDGSSEPNIRLINNFKRPFYITKDRFRNHKQKKEYEEINKVNSYTSIQSDLPNAIAGKLKMTGYKRNQYRDVLKSPYLYGSDVPSTVILSKMYEDKFGLHTTPYTMSTLDIESDVDTKDITVISSVYKNTIRTAISRTLIKNYKLSGDEWIIKEVRRLYSEHVEEKHKDKELIITIHDNEVDCIKAIFKFLHERKPDFLAIWNVMFDMPMMTNALVRAGESPKTIISDPDIPHELKRYEVKQGPAKKKKADGTVTQIDIQDRWHSFLTCSSFYIIDAMCAYSHIRAGASKVIGGYSLDNITLTNLGKGGKLKFEGLVSDNLSKEDWHRQMSRNHPLHYIVYNMGDNTTMCDLEDKTNDLSVVLPTLAGHSNFTYFNSGPSKIVDKLYLEILDDGLVLGTKPHINDQNKILGLDKWIVTLNPTRITKDGSKVLMNRSDKTV